MRPAYALALLLAGCAQEVVVAFDASGPSTGRDGGAGANDDARIGANDDARIGANDDASVPPHGDAGANEDASVGAPDATVGPSGCMRRIQDQVFVPEPLGIDGFSNLRALRFDASGQLYALSRTGSRPFQGWVTVLSPSFAPVRSIGRGRIRAAQDLIFDGSGALHVLDFDPSGADDPIVHVFDANGSFLRSWLPGPGGGEADSLAIDAQGRIYVGGLVPVRYAAMGQTELGAISAWGDRPGAVGRARGMIFDARGPGYLWVADLARNRVHQFDLSSDSQLAELGGRGAGPGQFDGTEEPDVRWGPSHIDLDAAGAIYVNDPFPSRIMKLSRQGAMLGEFSFGGTMRIEPIRVQPSTGNVLVGMGNAIAIVCAL